MRYINHEQGSPAWLEYRKTGIGASEAPIVMGLSHYCTPSLLYKRKKGLVAEQFVTDKMRAGNVLEPHARQHAIDLWGINLRPVVVEMDEFPFLFASLDGIHEESQTIIEIKSSDLLYEKAKKGVIDPMYICQMQDQMMVTGYKKVKFLAFDGFDCHLIEVKRDDDYIAIMKEKLIEFYNCLLSGTEPIDESKYTPVEIDYKQAAIVKEWQMAKAKIKKYEADEKLWREAILNFGHDDACELIYEGKSLLRMRNVIRQATIDYKALCMAKGITENDLGPYRKAEIKYWKLIELE